MTTTTSEKITCKCKYCCKEDLLTGRCIMTEEKIDDNDLEIECEDFFEEQIAPYGTRWIDYIKEYYPFEYEEYFLRDELRDEALFKNKLAAQTIMQRQFEREKADPDLKTADVWKAIQIRNLIRAECEEEVLNEIIYIEPKVDLTRSPVK